MYLKKSNFRLQERVAGEKCKWRKEEETEKLEEKKIFLNKRNKEKNERREKNGRIKRETQLLSRAKKIMQKVVNLLVSLKNIKI